MSRFLSLSYIVFLEHLKKEIEVRNKRVPTKEDVKNQVFFVDKARNAAVVIGDKDLKAEVKQRRNKERQLSCINCINITLNSSCLESKVQMILWMKMTTSPTSTRGCMS